MCFVPFCVSSVLVLLLFRTIQVRPSYIGSKVFVSLLPHYFLPLSDRMSGLSVKVPDLFEPEKGMCNRGKGPQRERVNNRQGSARRQMKKDEKLYLGKREGERQEDK